jgi:hypothetical protein
MPMEVVTLGGPLLALASLLVGVHQYRQNKKRTGRTVLQVSVVSRPLWPFTARPAGAYLQVEGTLVQNPYLVTIEIECLGPKDIKRSDFDDDRPLEIQLGAPLVTIAASDLDPVGKSGDWILALEPQLLKAHKRFTVEAVTEGVPAPNVEANFLIDIDPVVDIELDRFVRVSRPKRRVFRRRVS